MDALRAGVLAIGRNPGYALVYVAIGMAASLSRMLVVYGFVAGPWMDTPETTQQLITIFLSIYAATVYAGTNAVVLAWFGADIDRPLWRYHGWQDALRRFFVPWFILTLVYLVLMRAVVRYAETGGATDSLLAIACIYYAVHVPIGVAIMHQGRFEWRYLADGLLPLIVQLPRMILPFLAGVTLFFTALYANAYPTEDGALDWVWRLALLEVVGGLITCGIATTTWCTLLLHRDEADADPED